jgi:hypothetical protein
MEAAVTWRPGYAGPLTAGGLVKMNAVRVLKAALIFTRPPAVSAAERGAPSHKLKI